MVTYDENWLEKLNTMLLGELSNSDLDNVQIATALDISESTLYRRIQKITGKTPLKYIRNLRLQRAQELLLSGEYTTVKAIAHQVGFLKVAYFSQQYKKVFGNRPIDILQKNS